jgi:restriction system protein
MAVPGYQEFMLPLLKLMSDEREHTLTDSIDAVADMMKIAPADRELLIPSGAHTQLYSRVIWSITYLAKAMLLAKVGRGRYRITPRGIDVVRSNPDQLNSDYLDRFDEFRKFRETKSQPSGSENVRGPLATEPETAMTPLERIESGYRELREALADELLARVRALTPKRFEKLVVDVLVAMGYGGSVTDAAQVVGKSGDGGIDGVIKEDKLGLDMVYVQAKRYENDVGPGAIREFVGSLGEHKANKGVFITCGGFTSGAKEAAAKAHFRIVLIDGDVLAQHMIDHGVGVTNDKAYTVKKLDGDYFDEG